MENMILPGLVFVSTLLLGLPVFFVLGLACLTYFVTMGVDAWTILQRVFLGLNSFTVLAVPMFLLTGTLMDSGGTLRRLMNFAQAIVGHLKGGLAHVNIVVSMFFAGITGNATADVAALGPLEMAMMTDQGYEKDFAAAVTVSSACIGPVIPPSMPMVMYGMVANVSIGALFLAGMVPGILMGVSLMALVIVLARFENFPRAGAFSPRRALTTFVHAIGPMGLPIIILGGIYSGLYTVSESAAIACVYAFILGKFVYKEIAWSDVPKILVATGKSLSSACVIFSISSCFSYIIALENIPTKMANAILTFTDNKIVLLLLINVALLIVGCFMEGLSAILIIAPILVPTIRQMGIDPIHFGVVMAINMTLGLLTPPLGISLFIASSISNVPVLKIAKKAIPFFLVLLAVLALITYVPDISMFLPRMFPM